EKLKYQLEQQHIAYNYNYKQVVYTHLYKDYLFDVNAARPYSVTVTSEDYFSNVSLKKGQADLIIPEDVIPELTKHRPHGTTLIGTKRHHTKV
ncbi:ABC transporter permease, partial [Staphylococcus aureus]|nr:ABC transporter permease [Staphylococcus aureus]